MFQPRVASRGASKGNDSRCASHLQIGIQNQMSNLEMRDRELISSSFRLSFHEAKHQGHVEEEEEFYAIYLIRVQFS